MIAWMMALIPLLPISAALFIGLGFICGCTRDESGEATARFIAESALSLSFLLLLAIDVMIVQQGELPGHRVLGEWFSSGDYHINISLMLDELALIMAHLVIVLCLLSLRFSVNYLHREAGYQRFFMIMSLFTGAMLLVVMSGNAIIAFFGWELAGLSSYLLIAYSYERLTPTKNATRVFVSNRIGDAGFMLAMVMALLWLGSLEWGTLASLASEQEKLQVGVIAGGFVIAALVKSAQLPFSPWIARALEGPTPSSAIFYGSIMVHAGVFLLIRMQSLLEQVPEIMLLIAFLGLLTACYSLLIGFIQSDVKSALIFNTTAQTGLMFFSCGMGWFDIALIHLVAHAIWRSYQFLSAPSLMHYMSAPTRQVPHWLRRRKWLYTAALQHFWVEMFSDWLLVKPVQALARDIQTFDQEVVNRMVGMPGSMGAISSLAQWERQKTSTRQIDGDSGSIGKGHGVVGRLMEWVASMLHWFEEHLVLKGGDDGLQNMIIRLGLVFTKIDELLSRPRYLLLMLLITFVVIL